MIHCPACKSSDVFRLAYEGPIGNKALLSRPTEGMKANIVLRVNPKNPTGPKVYAIVPAGSPEAEFVNHRSVCSAEKGRRGQQ